MTVNSTRVIECSISVTDCCIRVSQSTTGLMDLMKILMYESSRMYISGRSSSLTCFTITNVIVLDVLSNLSLKKL